MATYERSVRVEAPLSEVWAFHSRVDGLKKLTPDWMHLRVESVRGPDGESDPGILVEGSEIDLSMRPLNVGPRQSWTSRIVRRREDDGAAMFRDVMENGPFDRWVHTHSFFADDGATVLQDRIEFRFPGPAAPLSDLGKIGLEGMFRTRHRRTKELLE